MSTIDDAGAIQVRAPVVRDSAPPDEGAELPTLQPYAAKYTRGWPSAILVPSLMVYTGRQPREQNHDADMQDAPIAGVNKLGAPILDTEQHHLIHRGLSRLLG